MSSIYIHNFLPTGFGASQPPATGILIDDNGVIEDLNAPGPGNASGESDADLALW